MSPVSRWDLTKEVCLAALSLPPEARVTYLDQACRGDPALRSDVESLLSQYDPTFLEEPLLSVAGLDGERGAPDANEGRTLGAYRLVRPVGRGGMGEVYLAVQQGDGFERPVAVKVVRAGMATDEVIERFRLERSILAGLNHPNLAKLIDGGVTEDGLPYFVMEFVEGESITSYCDRHSLSVADRLLLFMSVCDAVHHAHQSLVVHRDIKPANILVTLDGTPKLLDFGIGKVLDPTVRGTAVRTAISRRVLTPEYAAPEQVRGGVITTATDVHGLGVLLYELLTGCHPFSEGMASPEQLDRALLEATPTPPSTAVLGAFTTPRPGPQGSAVLDPERGREAGAGTVRSPSEIARLRGTVPHRLRRALRGDLDNIVLKALRKEPERRYSSAETFRADIRRHLDGRPVRARPDSLGYRVSKFVTRNPWGVVAASIAVTALAAAVVVPWQQNRRLTEERDKALAVQGFLLEGFGTTGIGESIGAKDLLDLQLSRLDTLYGDRPDLQAQMLMVVADAYDRLGLYTQALPPAERSLSVLRGVHEGVHPEVGRALNAVGWALHRAGRSEDAVAPLEDAISLRRRIGRSARGELARSLNDLGVVREALSQYQEAEALHREALDIRLAVLGDGDLASGVSASNLSVVLYRQREYDAAQEQGELALSLLRRSVGPDHQRTIIVQNNLAAFMVTAGDLEGAATLYRDLLERQTRLQGEGHPVTNRVRNGLAATLRSLNRYDEAYTLASEVRTHARAEGAAGAALDGGALATMISIRRSQGRDEEALRLLDEAVENAGRSGAGGNELERALVPRAEVRLALGDAEGAVADYGFVVAQRQARLEPTSDALARLRARLVEYLLAAGRHPEADSTLSLILPVLESPNASDDLRARVARVDSIRAASGR